MAVAVAVALALALAVAVAVSYWLLAAEALVQSQANPCGICCGQSGPGTSLSQSSFVFAYPYHSTNAPCLSAIDAI
jgi:hypothetical protein